MAEVQAADQLQALAKGIGSQGTGDQEYRQPRIQVDKLQVVDKAAGSQGYRQTLHRWW